MKKILDVRKVAFYGSTGDNRSPESLPFPACMTSLMGTLGNGGEIVTITSNGINYTKRCDNDAYLAASGMAFGLLWDKSYCYSSLDLTQVTPLEETVGRAFDYAGYKYEFCSPTDEERETLYEKVKKSIDKGVPVLGFGLFDPPECAIITGYDDDGVILGWSHFQNDAGLEKEENGMFRLKNWENNVWTLVFPGEKTDKTLSCKNVLSHGTDIMSKTEIDGYLSGQAAYDEWIKALEMSGELNDDDAEAFYNYHHAIMFTLAELRCWAGNFLRSAGIKDNAEKLFQAIHDNCWKADAAAENEGGKALRDEKKRNKIISIIREISLLDREAEIAIRDFSRINR